MSLQRRLTLFFIAIVMLPLIAAGYVVRYVVVGEVERRSEMSLEPALGTSVALYKAGVDSLDELVRLSSGSRRFASLLDEGDRPAMSRYLGSHLRDSNQADFLIALDRRGRLAGAYRLPARFATGFETPSASEIARAAGRNSGASGYASRKFPLRSGGRPSGAVIAGFWIDEGFLESFAASEADLAAVSNGRAIASTVPLEESIDLPDATGIYDLAGLGIARVETLTAGTNLIAFVSGAPIDALSTRVLYSMLGLLILALVLTSVLAYLLARLITQPLHELTEGAAAIAAGRFGHQIPVRSRDEVGRLTTVFNEMSVELRGKMGELSSSRDLLQRTVQRVGETLRSTHDMRSILDSILNTAADAVSADAAILWTFNPTRAELYPAITRDIQADDFDRVPVGHGLVGHVAERGVSVLRSTATDKPRPAATEPDLPVSIVVPIYSQERIMSVMTLYRHSDDTPFTTANLDTVAFLADQGRVAIENVILHEEAQRLSITDGLTGVWNRRFFQMQFRTVLAQAMRFDRPFSILMLDLDHFKQVNDSLGHQRGDATLIEFAQRVGDALREVDTFARYGGEEFICMLSETDFAGATITAEKILEHIRAEPFRGVGEEPIDLTASIGVASYPLHGDSYQTLVAVADQALYRAKQEGRNRVCTPGGPPPNLQVAR